MTPIQIAALLGALGVGLGAFGAHALREILETRHALQTWQTASHYHLLHAAVMLWVSTLKPVPKGTFSLFGSGILLFSGSLYILALTQIHWLGLITPFGGLSLILAWLSLVIRRSP